MIREGCQKKTRKVWSFAQKFNFFQGDPVFFFKRPLEGMDNVHWTWPTKLVAADVGVGSVLTEEAILVTVSLDTDTVW